MQQLLIGVTLSVIISFLSYTFKFLTRGGASAQCILGTILFGLGGWQWTVPMLAFFLLSSLLSKIGAMRKSKLEQVFEKSSRRDAGQVFANGGIAGIITLIWFTSGDNSLYIAYLGSVAAATADTWGTELGLLSRRRPLLLSNLKLVEHGRSGAISFAGVAFGLVGAWVIWLCGAYWLDWSIFANTLYAVTAGGFAGSVVDSLIGATLQAQFRCSKCNQITERSIHCGVDAWPLSGLVWIGNDLVNLACTFVGASVSLFGFSLIGT